jgi:hypothetical protein
MYLSFLPAFKKKFNFVMLLKWWSSIRVFSQTWRY